jgi:hypothetical protein
VKVQPSLFMVRSEKPSTQNPSFDGLSRGFCERDFTTVPVERPILVSDDNAVVVVVQAHNVKGEDLRSAQARVQGQRNDGV